MTRQRKSPLRVAASRDLPNARAATRSKSGHGVGPSAADAEALLATERRRLVQPLLSALDQHVLPRVAGGAVLAVSGGPDSRALLEATALWAGRFDGEIHVISVDHGTRASSWGEALAVAARAGALGFAATVARVGSSWLRQRDPRRITGQASPGGNTRVHPLERSGGANEAVLRGVRYRVLAERARILGLKSIIVAHHESDVAEGALLSWLGLGGAGAAMAAVRAIDDPASSAGAGVRDVVDVVRPFLTLTRETLRLALTAMGAHDVIVDPERSSRRAGVRHEELAALGAGRPDAERHLARAAHRRRDDEDALAAGATTLLDEVSDGAVRVRAGPPALLRRALRIAVARINEGEDARASSPAIDAVIEMVRCGNTGDVHLKGAIARVALEAVVVRAFPAKLRPVAAEAIATHDGLQLLSAGRSLITLPTRRADSKPHDCIETDAPEEEDP